MSDVPEWFERLKAEWPGEWEYRPNDGNDCAALVTQGGVEIRAWGDEQVGGVCWAAIESSDESDAAIFVSDLFGMTFAQLRESVAMEVENHMKAWREVQAMIEGHGEVKS